MSNTCLLNYYLINDELKNTCDFNPDLLKNNAGIYEVVRVIGAKPLFLLEHIHRFFHSASAAGMQPAFSKDWVKSQVKHLIEANLLKVGNIHFQMLHKNKFIAWIPMFKYPSQQQKKEGVEVVSLKAERKNPHIKQTNLPARAKADDIKDKTGIYEVILVNENGLITEGSRSNIFFIKNNILFTPELKLVLPGITQSKIFEVARQNKIVVQKKKVSLASAGSFESAFICSTSNHVLALKKMDSFIFDTSNPLTEIISLGFQQLVQKDLEHFSW